jgi:imidazolonepropionase-like amidohydrolase
MKLNGIARARTCAARVFATVMVACGATSSACADTITVTADRMIDVLTGRVIDHPQITVTDGRIADVGVQKAALPDGARRVDLPGMTLLPGLIDMHTHLTSDPHYSGYRHLEFTDNFWTVVGVANAKKTLEAGFTTVRNVGSANYDDVAIKQGIEHGMVPGPRIVPATYAIGATGGHAMEEEHYRRRSRHRGPRSPMVPRRSARRCVNCANTAPKSSSFAARAACYPRPTPSARNNMT